MIRTLSDLLDELVRAEAVNLAKNVKHLTLIGGLHEGSTRALLSRPLFEDLDLEVVSGLVIDGNGANG